MRGVDLRALNQNAGIFGRLTDAACGSVRSPALYERHDHGRRTRGFSIVLKNANLPLSVHRTLSAQYERVTKKSKATGTLMARPSRKKLQSKPNSNAEVDRTRRKTTKNHPVMSRAIIVHILVYRTVSWYLRERIRCTPTLSTRSQCYLACLNNLRQSQLKNPQTGRSRARYRSSFVIRVKLIRRPTISCKPIMQAGVVKRNFFKRRN